MARSFLAPTSTCSLVGASAAYVGECGGYVWFGLVAASDTAACCAFYSGSLTSCPLLVTMNIASGAGVRHELMVGPYKLHGTASLVYAQVTGTRASALVSYIAS